MVLVTVLRAGQLVTVGAQDVMVTRSVEKMVLSAATTARREAAMREKRILRDLFVGSGKGGISDDRRSWKRWEVKLGRAV